MTQALALFERPAATLELLCCGAAQLLDELPRRAPPPALVVADPPWPYELAPGVASPDLQYETLDIWEIARLIDRAYAAAARDARLALWITYPQIGRWSALHHALPWEYKTGGGWQKEGGSGVGYHWRGRAEDVWVYTKGAPATDLSAHLINGHTSPQGAHSEKPVAWMAGWLRRWVPLGGFVLDLFAGESASLARACRAEGVPYIGAEINPTRHAAALARLEEP